MTIPSIHETLDGAFVDCTVQNGDYLGPGTYLFDTLTIPNGFRLYVAPGTEVRAKNIVGYDNVRLHPNDGEARFLTTEDVVLTGKPVPQAKQIADIIAAFLETSDEIADLGLDVDYDERFGMISLSDDGGSLFRVDVTDCE